MKIKLILTIITCFYFSGCATIISGGSDHVSISSGGVEEATISVDGVIIGKENVITPLKRGMIHNIKVEKEGCGDGFRATGKKFDPTSLLGILIDLGIFTMGTDFLSGSIMKADQDQYIVSPRC